MSFTISNDICIDVCVSMLCVDHKGTKYYSGALDRQFKAGTRDSGIYIRDLERLTHSGDIASISARDVQITRNLELVIVATHNELGELAVSVYAERVVL